jgi:mRNA-degrading endonuclease RelE of RelBE toxin-antitoxin system
MAQYKIEVTATAERQLKKMPREDAIRILRAISLLAPNPRPAGCKK